MTTDITIKCPHCQNKIKITDAMAEPLVVAAREEFEVEKSAAVKEAEYRVGQVADARANDVIARQDAVLNRQHNEAGELRARLQHQEDKLAEAQKAQANFVKEQRALDDAKRELELTIQRQVSEGLDLAKEEGLQLAERRLRFKVDERELTISSMRTEIDNLVRKAEQGSQQAQGEAFELQIEQALLEAFPGDHIEPVPKGMCGGDIFQHVKSPTLYHCGTILWELKHTKSWSYGWLPKLRNDQRAAGADVCVLVSTVLPKGAEPFALIDTVWVVTPQVAISFALVLRQGLMEVSSARSSTEGQQPKMEQVYEYLTGNAFKLRVQAIIEAFTIMTEDLAIEKKIIMNVKISMAIL